jgi:hypothetical protein
MSNKKNHIGEANKMISSVEWLFQKLWDTSKDKLNWHSILKQAKEIEKEQKRKDFTDGYMHGNEPLNHNVIDKWYNETYGGNNEL